MIRPKCIKKLALVNLSFFVGFEYFFLNGKICPTLVTLKGYQKRVCGSPELVVDGLDLVEAVVALAADEAAERRVGNLILSVGNRMTR
jgi:hypothetical protein